MEFKTLFKYRNIWMGLAALWIVLYHAHFSCSIIPLEIVKRLGHGGVDIFLFASGIGCYFSYSKNLDFGAFFQRRLKRLLPTFYVFMAVWVAYKVFFSNISILEIFGNLSFVGYMLDMDNQFNWYISMVWFYYLLCPFIYQLFNHSTRLGKIFTLIFLAVFSACFYGNDHLLIFVSRIPIFAVGCYFAHISKVKKRIETKYIIPLLILMVIGFAGIIFCIINARDLLFTIGVYWYSFLLTTPGMCIVISFIADKAAKFKVTSFFNKVFSKLGEVSFEIYFVHIMTYDVLDDFTQFSFKAWVALFPCIILISFLLSWIVKLIEKQTVKILSHTSKKLLKCKG